jgi:phage/plasmid-like protein (TIGR03299 family)
MAHNLEIKDGVASLAYAGARPWHRLGRAVASTMTPREALVAGSADYIVSARPVLTPEGKTIEGHRAIVRDDTGEPLGLVKGKYTILNNEDAFLPLFDGIGKDLAVIETCGVLGKGERAWMMARVPETIEAKPGDPVEPWLLAHTSHDGSATFSCAFVMVRCVCQNTVQAALRGARSVVRLRHTKNIKNAAALVLDVLGASAEYRRRFAEAARRMARADVNRAAVEKFLRDTFPDKVDENGKVIPTASVLKAREETFRIFESEPTTRHAGENAWGLLQAATHYVDHVRPLRKGADRWEASVFGPGVAIRQRAFDAALALAGPSS